MADLRRRTVAPRESYALSISRRYVDSYRMSRTASQAMRVVHTSTGRRFGRGRSVREYRDAGPGRVGQGHRPAGQHLPEVRPVGRVRE